MLSKSRKRQHLISSLTQILSSNVRLHKMTASAVRRRIALRAGQKLWGLPQWVTRSESPPLGGWLPSTNPLKCLRLLTYERIYANELISEVCNKRTPLRASCFLPICSLDKSTSYISAWFSWIPFGGTEDASRLLSIRSARCENDILHREHKIQFSSTWSKQTFSSRQVLASCRYQMRGIGVFLSGCQARVNYLRHLIYHPTLDPRDDHWFSCKINCRCVGLTCLLSNEDEGIGRWDVGKEMFATLAF